MQETRLVRDARSLSSGTIARLIGDNNYDNIEREQWAFVRHCQKMGDETWQVAWQAYEHSKKRGEKRWTSR